MTAWTEERVAMLRKLAGTGTSTEVAAKIGGVSPNAVLQKVKRLGIECAWPHSHDGSKKRRILELAREGLPPRLIEQRMFAEGKRTTRHSILVTISTARRAGEDIPRFREKDGQIPVDCGEFIGDLTDAAHARGLTPSSLAGLILDAVVSDNLIDAVLDTEAA